MKFAVNLERHQVPEWNDFYVDYARLKRDLQLGRRHAPGSEDHSTALQLFKIAFSQSIDRCINFRSQQQDFFTGDLSKCGLAVPEAFAAPSGLVLQSASIKDETLLHELTLYLEKLTSFDIVNRQVVKRVLNKAAIVYPQGAEAFEALSAPWTAWYESTGLLCQHLFAHLRESQTVLEKPLVDTQDGLTNGRHLPDSQDAISRVDRKGLTVLDAAVIAGQTHTVKALLDSLKRSSLDQMLIQRAVQTALVLALRYGADSEVSLLAQAYRSSGDPTRSQRTPLHWAARLGRADYVKVILEYGGGSGDLDALEHIMGWTPMFVASDRGHTDVVEELVKSGADPSILDDDKWTAKERAVIKGYQATASKIPHTADLDSKGGPANSTYKAPHLPSTPQLPQNQKLLFLTLGLTQQRDAFLPFRFDFQGGGQEPSEDQFAAYTVIIACNGTSSPEHSLSTPILSDMVNEPLLFHVKKDSKIHLTFKIYRHDIEQNNNRQLIAGGAFTLENDRHRFGSTRESFVRNHTIPLIENGTLEAIGSITFSAFILYPLPEHIPNEPAIAFDEPSGTELVGHRGVGQNTSKKDHLQIGENTVESFLAASKLGATLMEFDIQVTRDLVPIVYHDFSLSESGTDVPISDVTLEQFMYASDIQSPRGQPVSVLTDVDHPFAHLHQNRKGRSASLSHDHEQGALGVQDRLKLTFDRRKGWKANTRGAFIQDTLITLEELLVSLPEQISLNAELKYPRLHDIAMTNLAPIAIEVNKFVDAALEKILRFGGKRRIILSSFSPEVCVAMRLKQSKYPVMLISNAGKPAPPAYVAVADLDRRTASLHAAVAFAKRWRLAGVCTTCETFLLAPRLVGYVKSNGLKCASYGLNNNAPENAFIQVEAGINMIMTDRVGLLAKALKEKGY